MALALVLSKAEELGQLGQLAEELAELVGLEVVAEELVGQEGLVPGEAVVPVVPGEAYH